MTRMIQRLLTMLWIPAGALLLGGAFFGGSAFAQNGPQGIANPGLLEHAQMTGESAKEWMSRMWLNRIDRFEHRQSELKMRLNITPAQEAAWNQYVQSIRPTQTTSTPFLDREQIQEIHQLPAPQRLERMMALQEQRHVLAMSIMQKRLDALKVFYPQLSAEQQKVFDRFTMKHHKGAWGGLNKPN